MLAGLSWIFAVAVTLGVRGICAQRADPRLIRSKYACEFDVMHLVCKPSTVLEIQAADFGGSAAIICGNSEESYQLCKLMDKTDTVKSRCDGKPQCYISALRSIFGNPCLGLNKQARTSIYLNVIYACVQPTNTGRSSVITPTQASTASTSISTAKDNSTYVTSTSLMNLTTPVNTTQPTSQEPTKKTVLTARSEEEGPATPQEIPVFDPAKSVELEVISGTDSVMRSSVVGFVIWVCIIGVIFN
ncbi:hypothetical protein ACROYT_G021914 [Oculina patagonica]